MTDHNEEPQPLPPATTLALFETPSDVYLGPQPIYDFCHSKRQDQSHGTLRDNSRDMGKKKQLERTREAIRFQALITQLEMDGVSQSEIARKMCTAAHDPEAVDTSYISLHRRGERQGIGSAIIRMVKDAFRVDPDYFFDDYEGVKDHKLYYLDDRRVEKQLRDLRAEHAMQMSALQDELASLRRAQAKTDADLAEVTKRPAPKPTVMVPPRKPGAPRAER